MKNKETGKIGEEIAVKYLLKNRYLILAKNHKERFDEIDVIARHPDGTLIFCEVKALNLDTLSAMGRSSWFMPEDQLSPMKFKKAARAARSFLTYHPELVWEDKGWQIDLVAIVLEGGKLADLRHYQNI